MNPAIILRFRDESENHVFPFFEDTAESFAERAMKSACRTLAAAASDLSAEEDPNAPAVRCYLLRDGASGVGSGGPPDATGGPTIAAKKRVAQVAGLTADEASHALLSLAAQRWAPGQNREAGLHAPPCEASAKQGATRPTLRSVA
jgi:hypothetical protein